MKIIMLGPPGAGKGTQANKISSAAGLPTLSTGQILRNAIADGQPFGLEAKSYMDAGALVPDDIIIKVVKEFLSKDEFQKGYILDGMPRTMVQAQMLDDMGVDIHAAILLELADDIIETRMSGRRVCPACGAVFNIVSMPPKSEGICDKCATPIELRNDDRPDTVKARLRAYHEQTEPIIDFYRSKGLLLSADAALDIDTTTAILFETLGLS